MSPATEVRPSTRPGGSGEIGTTHGSPVTILGELKFVAGRLEFRKKSLKFVVELLPQEDGGFVAHVPSLPGASTQGRDYKHAIEMVKETIAALVALGEPVASSPEFLATDDTLREVVEVAVSDEAAAA